MRSLKLISQVFPVALILLLICGFSAEAGQLKLIVLDKDVQVGDEITIAVQAQGLTSLSAAGFEVGFDHQVLSYTGLKPGELTRQFTLAANELTEGLIRVGMFSNTGQALDGQSQGSIALLNFKAQQKGEAVLKLQAPVNDIASAKLSGCSFLVR
jgi:hypothetical protein